MVHSVRGEDQVDDEQSRRVAEALLRLRRLLEDTLGTLDDVLGDDQRHDGPRHCTPRSA